LLCSRTKVTAGKGSREPAARCVLLSGTDDRAVHLSTQKHSMSLSGRLNHHRVHVIQCRKAGTYVDFDWASVNQVRAAHQSEIESCSAAHRVLPCGQDMLPIAQRDGCERVRSSAAFITDLVRQQFLYALP
jgi:hypothetical protein